MANLVISAKKADIVPAITKIRSNYDLTYDELSVLFDVPVEKIKNRDEKKAASGDIKAELRLNTEAVAISLLNEISDDSRLKAYIDELYAKYRLNHTLLSKLTGIEESNINAFMKNPDAISVDMKYTLCVKVTYLLFLFSNRPV